MNELGELMNELELRIGVCECTSEYKDIEQQSLLVIRRGRGGKRRLWMFTVKRFAVVGFPHSLDLKRYRCHVFIDVGTWRTTLDLVDIVSEYDKAGRKIPYCYLGEHREQGCYFYSWDDDVVPETAKVFNALSVLLEKLPSRYFHRWLRRMTPVHWNLPHKMR